MIAQWEKRFFGRYINIHELININISADILIQSHLFKRLVDHVPFAVIG